VGIGGEQSISQLDILGANWGIACQFIAAGSAACIGFCVERKNVGDKSIFV
jgi:hypothetical protein